jgi:hypothetical protein
MIGDIEKKLWPYKKRPITFRRSSFVTKVSHAVTQGWSSSSGLDWEGKNPNDKISFDRYAEDESFVKTTGVQIVKGRDFDLKNYPTDSTAMIFKRICR